MPRLRHHAKLVTVFASFMAAIAAFLVSVESTPATAAPMPTVIAGWNWANYVFAPARQEYEGASLNAGFVEIGWTQPITRVVGTFKAPNGTLSVFDGDQGGGGYLPACSFSDESEICWPNVWGFVTPDFDTPDDIGTWAIIKLVIADDTGAMFTLTDNDGFTGPMIVKRAPKFDLLVSVVKKARPGRKVKATITMRTKGVVKIEGGEDDRSVYAPGVTTSLTTSKTWKPIYKSARSDMRPWFAARIYWKDSKGKAHTKDLTPMGVTLNNKGKATLSFTMPSAKKVTGEVFWEGDWLAYTSDFATFSISKAKKQSRHPSTSSARSKAYRKSRIVGITIVNFP